MSKTEHYYTQFVEGQYYHVYNRIVDKQQMFRNPGNYEYFLRRYHDYLSPVVDTYAYCLLPNHFHLLVHIRDLSEFKKLSQLSSDKSTHEVISHQFQKFFQAYAMAFNKQHQRVGTLFQTPFKRVLIDDESYFTHMIFYIHANPQTHRIVRDFREWKWSSYSSIISLSDTKTLLRGAEVLNWFGGKDEYLRYHLAAHQQLEEKFRLDE